MFCYALLYLFVYLFILFFFAPSLSLFRFMYAHATTFLILEAGFLVTSHRLVTGIQHNPTHFASPPGLELSSLCQGTVWPEDGSSAKGFHGNCDLD